MHHSKETALVNVANDLASDNGLVFVRDSLDLGAFDNIDHHTLLQRLEHVIGIKGTALSWFKSYLSDKSQFVQVDNKPSLHTKVSHRVPQDSVLIPIQLNVCMLPLWNIIRQHSFNIYIVICR